MASNVILAKSVDVSKLRFAEPKTLSNQSRTVYINYNGPDKLTIQTPVMRLPFGLGDWNEKNNAGKKQEDATKKYDLNVSFSDAEGNPKMAAMLEKMQEIEKRIIDEAFDNRVAWLQDDYDGVKSLVAKLFVPIVKVDRDPATKKVVGKYPPTMKLKLPYDNRNDCFAFVSQDMDGTDVDFKSVMQNMKGAKARLIIQLSGLWFAGGRYGCTWKVVRGMFEVISRSVVSSFIEDSDDDVADAKDYTESDTDLAEDAAANAGAAEVTAKLKSATIATKAAAPQLVESDEDDEEDEVDEESDVEEPPPPPPAKKAATKKVAKK